MSASEHNEKSFEVNERVNSSSPSSSDAAPREKASQANTDEVDAAWAFLNEHRDVPGVDEVDLKKLRRRIDWRIVPIMFGCYTMQFLDKVIYNVRFFIHLQPDLVACISPRAPPPPKRHSA